MRSGLSLWRVAGITLVLTVSAACGHVSVDYVDFVQHGGIQYLAAHPGLGRSITEDDLRAEQFRVTHSLARDGTGGMPRDGDAAFVPAGDAVYAVRGYASTFRVAARHDGALVLYEADSNPAASVGRDLLDLDGRVAAVTLLSPKDGRTVLGRVADPARVGDLVSLVLGAPVDQSVLPAASAGAPEFVGFELTDGTVTSRAYFRDPGILQRGIRVAGAFRDAVDELRASAPTPTPVPALVNLAARYDLAHATRVTVQGVPGRSIQDPGFVSAFAAALDALMPATAATVALPSEYTVVIFEFAELRLARLRGGGPGAHGRGAAGRPHRARHARARAAHDLATLRRPWPGGT